MSHPERPQPNDPFGFTEHEKLYDRIQNARLTAILQDSATTIHRVELSSNTYGEFLFLTASRPSPNGRMALTFWGLGYHEYRERWYTDEWSWYQTSVPIDTEEAERLEKSEVERLLSERRDEIAGDARTVTQSKRGELFELLADLTDEDGAWAEIDDLTALFGDDFLDED